MNANNNNKNLYELAYLLPLQPEGKETETQNQLEKVKEIITKNKGVINQEQAPIIKKLSYPIAKQHEALFGFFRFTIEQETIAQMPKILKLESPLIRFTIVKITTQQLQEEQRPPRIRPTMGGASSPVAATYTPKPKEVTPDIKPEEFEKKLEEILKD